MAEGGNIFRGVLDKIRGKKKAPKKDDLAMFRIGGSDTSSNSSTNPIKKMRGATWGRQNEMARISAQEHQPMSTSKNSLNRVFSNPRESVTINPRNNVPMSSFRKSTAPATSSPAGSNAGSWFTDSSGYNIDNEGAYATPRTIYGNAGETSFSNIPAHQGRKPLHTPITPSGQGLDVTTDTAVKHRLPLGPPPPPPTPRGQPRTSIPVDTQMYAGTNFPRISTPPEPLYNTPRPNADGPGIRNPTYARTPAQVTLNSPRPNRTPLAQRRVPRSALMANYDPVPPTTSIASRRASTVSSGNTYEPIGSRHLMDFWSGRNTPVMERRNTQRASDLMGHSTPLPQSASNSIYTPIGDRNLNSPYNSGNMSGPRRSSNTPSVSGLNLGRGSPYAPVPTNPPAPRGFIQEPTVMRSKRGKPRHVYKPTLSDVAAGSGTSGNPLNMGNPFGSGVGAAGRDNGSGYLQVTGPKKKKGFFANLWAKRPFQGAGAKASKNKVSPVQLTSMRRTLPPPDFGARRYRDSAPAGSAPSTPVSSTARTPPAGFDVGSRVSSTVRRPPVGFGGSETGFKVPMGRSNSMVNLNRTSNANPQPWAGLTPGSGGGASPLNRRASLPPGSVVGSDVVPNSAAALARRPRAASTISTSAIVKKKKAGGNNMWKGMAGGMMVSGAARMITKPLSAAAYARNQPAQTAPNTSSNHIGDGDDPGYSSYDINFNPAPQSTVSAQNFQAKPI